MNYNKTTLCLVALISVSSVFAGKEITRRDAKLAAFDARVQNNQRALQATRSNSAVTNESNGAYQEAYADILNGQRPTLPGAVKFAKYAATAESLIEGSHATTAPSLSFTPNPEPTVAKAPVKFEKYVPATATEITNPMYTFVTKFIPVQLLQQVHPLVRKDGVVTPGALIINQPTTVLMPVVERQEVPAGHLYRQLSFLAPQSATTTQAQPVALHPVLSFLNRPATLHPDISFEITK